MENKGKAMPDKPNDGLQDDPIIHAMEEALDVRVTRIGTYAGEYYSIELPKENVEVVAGALRSVFYGFQIIAHENQALIDVSSIKPDANEKVRAMVQQQFLEKLEKNRDRLRAMLPPVVHDTHETAAERTVRELGDHLDADVTLTRDKFLLAFPDEKAATVFQAEMKASVPAPGSRTLTYLNGYKTVEFDAEALTAYKPEVETPAMAEIRKTAEKLRAAIPQEMHEAHTTTAEQAAIDLAARQARELPYRELAQRMEQLVGMPGRQDEQFIVFDFSGPEGGNDSAIVMSALKALRDRAAGVDSELKSVNMDAPLLGGRFWVNLQHVQEIGEERFFATLQKEGDYADYLRKTTAVREKYPLTESPTGHSAEPFEWEQKPQSPNPALPVRREQER